MNAQEKKDQSFIKKISDYLSLIVTATTVIGLVVTIFNFLLLNKLQPLDSAIQNLNKEVLAVKGEHQTFVNKDVFVEYEKRAEARDNDIIHRLDIISGRLDRIAIK